MKKAKRFFQVLLSLVLIAAVIIPVHQTAVGLAESTPTTADIVSDYRAYLEKMIAHRKAISLISWEMGTNYAPKGGLESWAKTSGILEAEYISMQTSPEMKNYIETLEKKIQDGDKTMTDIEKRMVELSRLGFDQYINAPVDEYKEYTGLTPLSVASWEQAKVMSDFKLFEPYLEKLVYYQIRFAVYRQNTDNKDVTLYDIFLNDSEPGMDTVKLDKFFGELKAEIVPLLRKIQASDKKVRNDFLSRPVPIEVQNELSNFLLNLVGYDFNRGFLAESGHPFTCGFGQGDVRITTHYDENNFLISMYSVLHEFGHANYEMNIDEALLYTILETGASMGIHESQSRFYENQIGRSLAFWESIYDDFIRITGDIFTDVSALELYEAANIVKPSLIRTEADELTYSLHIMIRYEIEKMLFENEIEVGDLPRVWNEKTEEYLGMTPPDDASGVLQDIHWSEGSFGYFPSYAIGNAYSAQFTNSIDFDIESAITDKDYEKINGWLKENIHQYGMSVKPIELLEKVTGEEMTSKYYIEYLVEKYTKLYDL